MRVGKYSMECQTREAVDILHRQFNKFITPSVPQQEERIQEVIDLAQRLYGELMCDSDLPMNKSVLNLIQQETDQSPHYPHLG